ncbi:TldD/PmbA family protein [bacterium]|nr:TldD/PmbA family protein [bacterium]MCP5462459.1 TldD/PmbA family protein [bacterium]
MDAEKKFLSSAQALVEDYKKRCDVIEIRFESSYRTYIQFQGKKLNALTEKKEVGANVRVYFRGGWGFVSFNDLGRLEEFVDDAYRQAVIIASHRKDSYVPIPSLEPACYELADGILHDPRSISLREKCAQLENYNNRALAFHNSITSSRSTYFDHTAVRVLITSDGVFARVVQADIGGAVIPIGTSGSVTQQYAAGFGGSNDYRQFLNLEKQIDDTCQTVVDLLNAPKMRAGTYPVICDPVMGGVFVHEAFGHLSESDSLIENKKLQEIMQFGRTFGSEKLNVYDSGLVKGARGYLPVDDEGVQATKQYLIKKGKLCGRLHTRETAARLGEKPTGNARAMSYQFPPICRMRDTVIQSGNDTFDDVIKDIDYGLYAVGSKGGQTNGEMFTFTASKGYMIRNGQIAELVRDVTLTGNVFTTLANIDAVCDDQQIHDTGGGCGKGEQFPLPVSHESPHIRIKNATVGGE